MPLYDKYIKSYGKVRSGASLNEDDYNTGETADTDETRLGGALAVTIGGIDARKGRDIRSKESLLNEIGIHEETLEEVGKIKTKTGLVWLSDPAFCIMPEQKDKQKQKDKRGDFPAKDWKDFRTKLEKLQENGVACWPFKAGNDGLGISISRFGGDGFYPVFVRRDKDGMIKFIKIVFQQEER